MFKAFDVVSFLAILVGTGAAVITDVRSRRIPNAITVTTAVAGLALAGFGYSRLSIGASMAGALVGLLLMMPGHLLGGTGAGDVKLMGAVGAILGPRLVFSAFLYTALAGGVMAVIVAARRRRVGKTVRRAGRVILEPGAAANQVIQRDAGNRFAYGPAIAAGAALAALGF